MLNLKYVNAQLLNCCPALIHWLDVSSSPCSVRNGHIRKVFATLYKYSGLVSDKRDIYEEFLSTPHYCPSATIVEQTPYSGAWRLPNMKELSEELQKMLDNKVVQFRSGGVLPLHREKLRTSQDTLTSWTYGVVDQTQFHTPIVRKPHVTVIEHHCDCLIRVFCQLVFALLE